MKNIQRNENYNQVCVWPGALLPEEEIEQFVNYFSEIGFRVQHLETIKTASDRDSRGFPVEGTGGRSDILFAIHDEDVMKFAIPRLQMGIRWIEDVLDNEEEGYSLYPERFSGYRNW